MKLAFINPSLRPESIRRQLPVGLAYVMTAVKKAGYDFDLIDMDIDMLDMDGLAGILRERNYDVIAFGCIVTGFKFIRQITKIVKETNPEAIIIAGNSVATSIPEILLKNTAVDIAVLGEGDVTIVELLDAIGEESIQEAIGKVSGIAYKRDNEIVYTPERQVEPDIDNFGFPEWDLFDLEKYHEYGKINVNISSTGQLSYPLNAARGCPFSCTFCYHVFKGKKYRKYSEGAIINEIRRLHEKYGCDFISFWDELTFPNIKSVEKTVESLRGLGFNVGWEATARGNLFKKEHLDLIKEMKEVGCDSLSFSLENASAEILAAMHKRMDVDQFIEQVNVLWDGGITPLTSVIFGYPQETPESIKKTLAVCEACNIYPSVGFLLPLPGTQIYEWAKENGHIQDEVEYLERIGDRQDFHINLTAMPDAEFIGLVENGLKDLAVKQGLNLESVFKTGTYQKPKAVT